MLKTNMNKPVSKNKKIIITDRDERLFKYLFAHKGASIKQIHRDIFPESNERKVYRRTQKLRNYGLINANVYSEKIQFGVFNITKKGLRHVYDLDEDLKSCELTSGNLQHDGRLLDLKILLSKMQCFDFYATENEIESGISENINYPITAFKELHCDALLGIEWEGQKLNFAIEYENSEKSAQRYYDHLQNYYAYPSIENVIYFTKNNKISRRIINADKKILENRDCKNSKIFVTNIEELKQPFTKLKTLSTSGDFLEFHWSKAVKL